MTRINLDHPVDLMDQHLFSEFREIKMVPKSLARSIAARGVEGALEIVPLSFCLNRGHVSFFYNKGAYLYRRYRQIKDELHRRGYKFNERSELDPDKVLDIDPRFMGDYEPTELALAISRERIRERIAAKPEWYLYMGVALYAQRKAV